MYVDVESYFSLLFAYSKYIVIINIYLPCNSWNFFYMFLKM